MDDGFHARQHGQWQKIPHIEPDGRLQPGSFGHRGGHVFARNSSGMCVGTAQTGTRDDKIIVDNGPEFLSRVVDQWAYENEVKFHFIEPGKPTQNAYIESFNGKFRDECLNQNWFLSLNDARRIIEEWRVDYNTARPHSSLGYQTPIEFAARLAPPPAPVVCSTPWSQTEALDNERTMPRPD